MQPSRQTVSPVALKEAREAAGLSTRDVAIAVLEKYGLRVSHATIASYERGASSPRSNMLAALAELYKRPGLSSQDNRPSLTAVAFRKAISLVKVSEEKAYLASANHWLAAYRRLEELADQPLERRISGFDGQSNDSPQQLAVQVRKALCLAERDTVVSIPEIVEKQFGVRMLELPTSARMDGLAGLYGDNPVVVVNPGVSADRCRMNGGHELGHVLYGDGDAKGLTSEQRKQVEDRAFDFASNLLMPEPVLNDAFRGRSMVRLVEFKERYGISLGAMVYRAARNGILNAKESAWLWQQFATRGWRRNEPGYVRPDRATRFEQMFESLTGPAGSMTRDAACAEMGVDPAEMLTRLRAAVGCASDDDSSHSDDDSHEGGHPNILRFPT